MGLYGVTALTNGNYVINSPNWNNDAATKAGAATWGSGTAGISGVVSSANSLVGSTAYDNVGYGGVTALTNGNYVVSSPYWHNGTATQAGAVTWESGTVGISGVISSANSLVGSTAYDKVGISDVTALTNGNYVVNSPCWHNGAVAYAGAVTWGSGTDGVSGVVSSANSLVGSTTNDQVGYSGVTALTNGNYVVCSPDWNNGAVTRAGAVTWESGTAGVSGVVSSSNSLVGSHYSDRVGNSGVTALTNGNYVISSYSWANIGAVTWENGTTGISGVVSSTNSLVGSTYNDQVGYGGVTALTNGNYVVRSQYWDNGAATDAGAVTWGSGTVSISGVVSSANSLVGSTANDNVGYAVSGNAVTALTNGNYVVSSPSWHNGAATSVGAATWGSGTAGISGVISSTNSLVGLTSNSGLSSEVADNVNGTFYASFYTETGTPPGGGTYGGRVRVGSQSAPISSQAFASQTGQSVTLAPAVTGTLNTGAAVTLQASNDITITNAITADNPGGNGGNLTLQAGRSLFINADITTDNGNLTLTANDTLANGVVDADRDSGSAVITQAAGTTLNIGTGTLTINLCNSSDKTNNDRGTATLQDLSAGSIILNGGSITVTSIFADTFTLGPGTRLTIAAIPGGRQAAKPQQKTLTQSLADAAFSPVAGEITNQSTVTSLVAQSSLTSIPVKPGPLAASTVIATPLPATSEAAPALALSDSLSNTVFDAVATPAKIIPDTALPACLVECAPARLIDTAINRLPSQSPIYAWIGLTALPKIGENWLENPLAGKQTSSANIAVFASLHDESLLPAGIIEKRAYAPATNGWQVDFAAWQTIGETTGDEADFDITRHARAGKHSKQFENAIDEVLAEEDAILVEL